MTKKLTGLFLSAILLVFSHSATAAIIKVDYDATVDVIGTDLIADTTVQIGDSVAGSFSYDTTSLGSGISFSISIAGVTLSSSNPTIFVQNNQQNGIATNPADGLIVLGVIDSGALALNSYDADYIQFGLREENSVLQLWDDTNLPDLSDWGLVTTTIINNPSWHFVSFDTPDNTGTLGEVRWSVDSFSVTQQVPEPVSLSLFALGMAGLGFTRRRKLAA